MSLAEANHRLVKSLLAWTNEHVVNFRCRGPIKVKGKGDMITYFLVDHNQQSDHRQYRGTYGEYAKHMQNKSNF